MPIGMASQPCDLWQEVSLVTFPIRLTPFIRQQLYRRLRQAYASGSLRRVPRIHALLAIAEGMAVGEVAQMLSLREQTVGDYHDGFLWRGGGSVDCRRPPGGPIQVARSAREERA